MKNLNRYLMIALVTVIFCGIGNAQKKISMDNDLITANELVNTIMPRNHTSSIYPVSVKFEYAIQVGAFTLKSNAVKLQSKLSKAGYEVDVYENYLDGKGLLYLVWVGNFKTVEDADSLSKELSATQKITGVLRMRSATMFQTLRQIASSNK